MTSLCSLRFFNRNCSFQTKSCRSKPPIPARRSSTITRPSPAPSPFPPCRTLGPPTRPTHIQRPAIIFRFQSCKALDTVKPKENLLSDIGVTNLKKKYFNLNKYQLYSTIITSFSLSSWRPTNHTTIQVIVNKVGLGLPVKKLRF